MGILSVKLWKLNIDAVKIRDWGKGWGWVIRDCNRDMKVTGIKQKKGIRGAEIEEAEACLKGV